MLPFLLLALFFSSTAYAGDDALSTLVIPGNMKYYASAYKEIGNAKKPGAIVALYQLGEQARRDFFDQNSSEFFEGIISSEDGSREKFEQQMKEQVPGYHIAPGVEYFYYYLDGQAFSALAKQYGNATDQAFFALYLKHFPRGGTWPAYEQQQTDLVSCTKYGSPEYISFYQDWTNFLAQHGGGYYGMKAASFLENLDIDGRCSCDSKESSIKGLEALAELMKDTAKKELIASEIAKRKAARDVPANELGGHYGYNGEQCGG